jgi:hypothetical protein
MKEKFLYGYNDYEAIMNIQVDSNRKVMGVYRALGYSGIFGENVNVMLLAIIFVYFLSMLIFIGSKYVIKSTSKKFR